MHAAVICLVIAIAAGMTYLARHGDAEKLNRRFAGFLYLVCAVVFLRDLRPDHLGLAASLPLHICDITAVMAAVTIHKRYLFSRRILHFWGLALSSQAFFFPILKAGPIHTDFWLYWTHHGAIVIAAIYDLTVNEYRPGWSDWRFATLALAAYTIVMIPFDALLGVNYGYLGQAHVQRSVVLAFGPYPDRLPALWLTAVALMTLLRLRWPTRRVAETQIGSIQTLRLPFSQIPPKIAA